MTGTSIWLSARPWVSTACRLIVGSVFISAGLVKIGDLAGSGRAVNAYQILPYGLAKTFGAILPFVEITVGGLLIVGLATRFIATVAAAMLVGYIAAIASVWARGLAIDCGCFSHGGALAPGESPGYSRDIARDAGMLALAVFLALCPRTPFSADGYLLGPATGRPDTRSLPTPEEPEE